MLDEHFMRQWNESHDAFSAGVTRMTAKFEPCGLPDAEHGAELRYAHANRIFVAIIAGLIAGIAVSTVATADAATMATAQVDRAPILA